MRIILGKRQMPAIVFVGIEVEAQCELAEHDGGGAIVAVTPEIAVAGLITGNHQSIHVTDVNLEGFPDLGHDAQLRRPNVLDDTVFGQCMLKPRRREFTSEIIRRLSGDPDHAISLLQTSICCRDRIPTTRSKGFDMTTVRFGLTAMAPGQVTGQAWDALWIGLSAWNTYLPTNGLSKTTQIAPITFGTTLVWEPWSPYELGVVTVYCFDDTESPQYSEENFTLNAPWNAIKDIELTKLDSAILNVTGFVDTWIAAPDDNAYQNITVNSAKRGAIDLGNGNNVISVGYLSNDYTWSNHFHIGVGNGNNTIEVQPEDYSEYTISGTPLPQGWSFNTEPDQTTVGVALGSGNNTVELEECSGTITMGGGTNTITLVDGHNALVLSSGTSTVAISAFDTADPKHFALATDRGSDIVQIGSGHADISIDDTMTFMTPLTTVIVMHGDSGTRTSDGPDDIRYGHTSGSTFVGGDWSALTLDLIGYSAGSSATLTAASDHTVLTIQDAAGGAVDVLNLYGAPPSSVAALHLRFT
jgi:hypothetical protein